MLEEALAEGGPWILGDQLTLADFNLMPYAARLDYLGLLGLWFNGRPRTTAWWERAREWPSFRRGLRDRITEAEFIEMRTHGPKIRDEMAALLVGLRRENGRGTN